MSLALIVLAGYVAAQATAKYEADTPMLCFAAAVGAATGIIAWDVNVHLLRIWLRRTGDVTYSDWIDETRWLRAAVFAAPTAAVAVIQPLRARMAALAVEARRGADSEALRRDAELFKLRQQFGPHFLYNSLNSVSALVAVEPDKAQEMIGRLAHFMRASVRRETAETVPLKDELEYLHEYLSIEAVRFGDRLHVVIEDEEGCSDCTIPPFLLQPLLENAIKYGVYGTTGPVEISVVISKAATALRIVIANPYDPLTAPRSGTGFGLEGVGRRLALLFGRTDLLQTSKSNNTFTTILTIPQNA